MILPFQHKRDGVHLSLAEHERALLGDLAGQLVTLLEGRDEADPAVSRLFPPGYSGDDEADAEFRRLTADDLTASKIDNAKVLIASLDTDRRTPLAPEVAQAWLRSLTDLRLTLASRLGVTDEGIPQPAEQAGIVLRDVYEWLGYVQESLVRALDR
ncbi:hypothetical protein GCM10025867_14510 [Frondihabitans sucicola]|uniref:DUF2017 domain-containing protein n=1 Tax=Frondihabitans sucicola TaxID=1268041 RepID=A0ABM8GLD4_9MICO|nr:DUF2017 domain-containing protein [Frondihabitans sucicola]BDZ49210.1 hypothetical protein GCM10025867_14510 [Frondihabitans sucicola]